LGVEGLILRHALHEVGKPVTASVRVKEQTPNIKAKNGFGTEGMENLVL